MADDNAVPPPPCEYNSVSIRRYRREPHKSMIYNRARETANFGLWEDLRKNCTTCVKTRTTCKMWESEYEQIRADLNSRLMSLLNEQNDPTDSAKI